MWNLKYNTNEQNYKTETDSQTLTIDFWLPRQGEQVGKGRNGSLGSAEANYYI